MRRITDIFEHGRQVVFDPETEEPSNKEIFRLDDHRVDYIDLGCLGTMDLSSISSALERYIDEDFLIDKSYRARVRYHFLPVRPKEQVNAHYTAVLAENQQKNTAFGLAQAVRPDLAPDRFLWRFEEIREAGTPLPRKLSVGLSSGMNPIERRRLISL